MKWRPKSNKLIVEWRFMNTSAKLALLLIPFLVIVGCKAESPTTSSSDNSSSTSTDTGTDTGTGTTSYVGKWGNSNNTIGVDWRSDSFIYICTSINNVTYAGHGSYSSSNTRLTWWDGSYNTVSSSGSNIILGSTIYTPAVLYANCNPFWTYHTSENTSYTNLAKSIGYWRFIFSIGSTTFTDYFLMSSISSAKNTTDNNYINVGTDAYGNVVTGTYSSSYNIFDILDDSASNIGELYAFQLNSTNSGISNGCYYQYNKSTSTWSSCYAMSSGTKLYGTPRAYRIISDIDEDTIAVQKQLDMQEFMSQKNNKLSEQDIAAFKRYKQLLQIHNKIDQAPLRKYLQSFRYN